VRNAMALAMSHKGHQQKSDLAHPESGLPPEPDIKRFVALVSSGQMGDGAL